MESQQTTTVVNESISSKEISSRPDFDPRSLDEDEEEACLAYFAKMVVKLVSFGLPSIA
jgi:hypothetical protein